MIDMVIGFVRMHYPWLHEIYPKLFGHLENDRCVLTSLVYEYIGFVRMHYLWLHEIYPKLFGHLETDRCVLTSLVNEKQILYPVVRQTRSRFPYKIMQIFPQRAKKLVNVLK